MTLETASNNRTVLLVAMAIGILVAVVHSPAALDPPLAARAILLGLGVAVGAFGCFKTGFSWQALRSPIVLLFTGFVALQALSLTQATVPGEGVFQVLEWSGLLGLLLVFASFRERQVVRWMALSAGVSAFAIAAILLGFFLDFSGELGKPTATFGGINQYAATLAITLGFSAYLSYAGRGWVRWLGIIATVATTAMCLYLGARASLLGMAVSGAIVGLVVMLSALEMRKLVGLVAVVVALGLVAAVPLFFQPEVESAAAPPLMVGQEVQAEHGYTGPSSDGIRLELWSKTWNMIAENPVLGVGAGHWRIAFPKQGLGEFWPRVQKGEVHYQRAHNDYLEIWAETGILGLLCFLGLLLVAGWSFIRQLRTSAENEAIARSASAIMVIVAFATIALFSFPAERLATRMLLVLALAGLVPVASTAAKRVRALPLVAVVLGALLMYGGWQRHEGERITRKVLRDRTAGRWAQVVRGADDARSFWYRVDPFGNPLLFYKGLALHGQNKLAAAQLAFEEARTEHPNHLLVLNNLGSTMQLLGNGAAAEGLYLEALALSPRYDEVALNLGAVYFGQQAYSKAFEALARAPGNSRHASYERFAVAIVSACFRQALADGSLTETSRVQRLLGDQDVQIRVFRAWRTKRTLAQATWEDFVAYAMIERGKGATSANPPG